MTALIESRPATTPEVRVEPRRTRGPYLVIAALAAAVLALGGALLVGVGGGEDLPAVPEDVQTVLDDFQLAITTGDFDAFQSVVTRDFRNAFYRGQRDGIPWRMIADVEDFRFLGSDAGPAFDVERVGDPMVRGDGPWYVTYAENWRAWDVGVQYEWLTTYVVVDVDGTLLIAELQQAGHSVVLPE